MLPFLLISAGLSVTTAILWFDGDYEDPLAWQLLIVAAAALAIVWLPSHFRGYVL